MPRTRVCADCRTTIETPAETVRTGFGGTGWARTPGGRTVCYGCAAARERRAMIRTGQATLYLVAPSGPLPGRWQVTNWSGTLEFPARGIREGRHRTPFGWRPYVRRLDAWFNGPDGFIWHAVSRGDMDIARCKRTRERVKA
jgi:hypothetical protein